jgi:hypothetical protein
MIYVLLPLTTHHQNTIICNATPTLIVVFNFYFTIDLVLNVDGETQRKQCGCGEVMCVLRVCEFP